MIKVKIKLPQIDQSHNSQQDKGIDAKDAKRSERAERGKSKKSGKGNLHQQSANNKLASSNIKVKLGNNLKANQGLALGKSKSEGFPGNTNLSLNVNSKGFSLGLNQNLQIAVTLLFEALSPQLKTNLKGFTSQAVVTSLLLNTGLHNQIQNNSGTSIRGKNTAFNNPVLSQILTILSNNNPATNPTQQVINLWNNSGGIFRDCGCVTSVKDLQKMVIILANSLKTGDIKTIVKLNEILQKGQTESGKGNTKLQVLLEKLISDGKTIAVKDARIANLTQTKTINEVVPKTIDSKAQPFADKTAKLVGSDQLFGVKDQILITEKSKFEKTDFYSEKTENTLRKQLDYYPHYAYDRQISAFENSDDMNLGKQEFVTKHYSEIEDWLDSGKHRLVKDFEFDKPIGMVVERNESGFVTADTIRVVLVRDGSVDGWHFLRSFLIT